MLHRPLVLAAAFVVLAMGAACGPDVDLRQALKVTDVVSGYYDDGLKDGKNYLVPSVTFRLENSSPQNLTGLELTVAYWRDGEDGEWESTLVQSVGNDTIRAGSKSDPLTVRCRVGYTLEEPRADLFAHSLFKDVTAKIFARRGGTIVPIGEVKLDRQILPHVKSATGRP
ncbi:MAG TPA: hypothetical protein VLT86_00480 [Vicinamibacterales bacterium]|nr:hypothetical protein [Vicinamibacterales bacterium]